MPSLTQKNEAATNSEYWLAGGSLGSRLDSNSPSTPERNKTWEEAILAYSWWRVMKGNQLSP